MTASPRVSVIIPTHNRLALLRQVVESLLRPAAPGAALQIVVVADACRDDTVHWLRRQPAAAGIVTIETPGVGAGAARNRGAAAADGDVLIFLDDDVVPGPKLVEAHLEGQHAAPGVILLGYSHPRPPEHSGLIGVLELEWWQDNLETMLAGRRSTFRDFVSCNFSIGARQFRDLGGFDESYRRCEDYELGARAIRAGLEMRLLPAAGATHFMPASLQRALSLARAEGEAHARLAQTQPALAVVLPLGALLAGAAAGQMTRRHRLERLAMTNPAHAERIAAVLARALPVLERLDWRQAWRKLYFDLAALWYARGAAQVLGGADGMRGLLAEAAEQNAAQTPDELEVDLAGGLEAAEAAIEAARPASILVRFGPRVVGCLPPEPGAERLRGRHLRAALEGSLLPGAMKALAAARGEDPELAGRVPGRMLAAGWRQWDWQLRDDLNGRLAHSLGSLTAGRDWWQAQAGRQEQRLKAGRAEAETLEQRKQAAEAHARHWHDLAEARAAQIEAQGAEIRALRQQLAVRG